MFVSVAGSFSRKGTTSAVSHTPGMYASSNMRWMISRRRLSKIVSHSYGIDGVPDVSYCGSATLTRSAGGMPPVQRTWWLCLLCRASQSSGQVIRTRTLSHGSRWSSLAAFRRHKVGSRTCPVTSSYRSVKRSVQASFTGALPVLISPLW